VSTDIHELVGAFATDALDDAERAAFGAHLADCADCRAELAAYREVLAAVAGAHPVLPPAELEDAVVAAASATTTAGMDRPDEQAVPGGGTRPHDPSAPAAEVLPLRRARRAGTWLGAAAAAAAIFAGGILVGRQGAPVAPVAPVAAGDLASVVAVASAEDAHFVGVDILGTETRVVTSDEMGKSALLASDLPMPAKGMCYQVWQVTEAGEMVSAGAFTPDGDGHLAVVLEGGTAGVAKYMVTLEPPGGSAHPTGEMIAEVAT